ncbi:1869_t:CDS:1 [Acaulospora morrowiae]|uniref:1869_t:CDS:1 n=1 Tax=Acaulospora morrowiae TaxID=94023 RepID=A0A9N9H3C1_9GLOM|nr:1869_t:CDS:1 [Acaulospora morrowiae]
MDDTLTLQFVAEAMSSLIGCRVVATESEGPALDIDLVHKYCLFKVDDNGEVVKRPRFEDHDCFRPENCEYCGQRHIRQEYEETWQGSNDMTQIFFNIFGESRSIFVDLNSTVLRLRREIQERLETDEPLSLRHFGHPLIDCRTLGSYDITQGSTIHVSHRLLGGFLGHYTIAKSFLKPQFDYDYTYRRDNGLHRRGYERYHLPIGWKKFGLNVDRYGDYKWLGTGLDAWPISYHGTDGDAAGSIAVGGYDINKGKRFAYGRGIYSSPYSDVAEKYSKEFTFSLDNNKYKLMFQNRVDPTDLRKENQDKYWITNSDQNIRPYALCYKRID